MIDGMLISEPSLKYIFLPQVILSLSWSTQADGKNSCLTRGEKCLSMYRAVWPLKSEAKRSNYRDIVAKIGSFEEESLKRTSLSCSLTAFG